MHEGLFPLRKEVCVTIFLASTERALARELLLNGASPSLGSRHWNDVLLLHEVEELAWDLLKSLLGKLGWIVLELTEWNKLDNISLHILLILLRIKWNFISIKDIHALEVIAANSNYDNREGK